MNAIVITRPAGNHLPRGPLFHVESVEGERAVGATYPTGGGGHGIGVPTWHLAILLKKLAEDELGLSNANLCKLAVKKGGGTAPAGPLSEVRRGLLKPCKGINFLPVLSLACRYSLLCAARDTDQDGEFEFFDTDLGYEGATPLPQTAKHSGKKAKWLGICPPLLTVIDGTMDYSKQTDPSRVKFPAKPSLLEMRLIATQARKEIEKPLAADPQTTRARSMAQDVWEGDVHTCDEPTGRLAKFILARWKKQKRTRKM